MSEMTCEHLRELDAELALGILPAQERARAVAHLDHCADCRVRVEQLSLAADVLLGLLPGTEPPVGFETRVAKALRQSNPPVQRRRLLRPRIAAVAAALAVACGFAGWAAGTAINQATAPSAVTTRANAELVQAPFMADGLEVGRVFVHPGTQGWVYMAVDLDGEGLGAVRCVLVHPDGSMTSLGTFALNEGYGYWVAPAHVDPTTLSSARLLAPDGSTVATARFT
ncbi:hypothetical protein ABZ128_01255 [Streptomyces sp. NPDC006326]|uniref:anti-sigma factor n=1 Tax=Streptomyces sp. NPDC006326 TaxID=3156752 RepID=UPI0033A22E93